MANRLAGIQPEAVWHYFEEICNVPHPSKKEEKIAVPVAEGILSSHFGHCEQFLFATVAAGKILGTERLTPPPHEPGVIPAWLAEQGATVVLVGGMGERAQQILEAKGITVICGIKPADPVEIVNQYLAKQLTAGENACSHDGDEHHDCGH